MKKIVVLLVISLLLIAPTESVMADKMVKVYMFEAGGCPYCEAEEEYLKGLSSYGTKFELIKKELYVDHVDWVPGKDFELGKTVAEAFKNAGFADAAYNATPFVVISNIYAAASYNTSLESIIDEAYEKGDKDVVGCFESGKTNCLKINNGTGDSSVGIILTIIVCSFILLVTYIVKSNNDKAELLEAISKKNKVK